MARGGGNRSRLLLVLLLVSALFLITLDLRGIKSCQWSSLSGRYGIFPGGEIKPQKSSHLLVISLQIYVISINQKRR